MKERGLEHTAWTLEIRDWPRWYALWNRRCELRGDQLQPPGCRLRLRGEGDVVRRRGAPYPEVAAATTSGERNPQRGGEGSERLRHDGGMAMNVRAGEVCVATRELAADLKFLTERLGFQMELIYPADDPAVVVVSGYGVRLRLERAAAKNGAAENGAQESGAAAALRIRLVCEEPEEVGGGERELVAPGGMRIELVGVAEVEVPATKHELIVRRLAEDAPWVIGRAGMHYRDLIPGRLGGAVIASHIKIPEAGPVPDLVHYHAIKFQLIFCCHGWAKLVYEDQGPPFLLREGDCVIQPPEIRHRVLQASENLQVIEVGLPAEHMTRADHELELPTRTLAPERIFGGQRFCRSVAPAAGDDAAWGAWRLPGYEARETGIEEATGGVASVRVGRVARAARASTRDPAAAGAWTSHTADVLFTFVLKGGVTLRVAGQDDVQLVACDAFVIPPGVKTALSAPTDELELLEVALPGAFETQLHDG